MHTEKEICTILKTRALSASDKYKMVATYNDSLDRIPGARFVLTNGEIATVVKSPYRRQRNHASRMVVYTDYGVQPRVTELQTHDLRIGMACNPFGRGVTDASYEHEHDSPESTLGHIERIVYERCVGDNPEFRLYLPKLINGVIKPWDDGSIMPCGITFDEEAASFTITIMDKETVRLFTLPIDNPKSPLSQLARMSATWLEGKVDEIKALCEVSDDVYARDFAKYPKQFLREHFGHTMKDLTEASEYIKFRLAGKMT